MKYYLDLSHAPISAVLSLVFCAGPTLAQTRMGPEERYFDKAFIRELMHRTNNHRLEHPRTDKDAFVNAYSFQDSYKHVDIDPSHSHKNAQTTHSPATDLDLYAFRDTHTFQYSHSVGYAYPDEYLYTHSDLHTLHHTDTDPG